MTAKLLLSRLEYYLCKLLPTSKKETAPTTAHFTPSPSPPRTSIPRAYAPSTFSFTHISVSMPAIESNEASASVNRSNVDQGTTQILPTKYFRDIDSLVKILQELVGEKGTFEIEVIRSLAARI